MIKLFFIAILAVGVAGGGGYLYWLHLHPGLVLDPTAAGTATVERGPIVQSVESTGTVSSNLDVQIKCQASGTVLQLGPKDRTKMFDVSDKVKAGDLLIEIDPTDEKRALELAQANKEQSEAKLEESKENLEVAKEQLQQAHDSAYANLASAREQLKDAQSKAARRKELLAQNLDTQEDYDGAVDTATQMQSLVDNDKVAIDKLKTQEYQLQTSEEDVKLSQAMDDANQVAVDEAKTQLGYCTVTAPMDGVITTLSLQQGTIISSATSVVGGAAAMVLSDLSHIYILADVDESEIGVVDDGQEVDITADSYPGKHFEGTVFRKATEGVAVSNVVTFEVKIEVTSKNKDLLLPQMTTNVNIIQARKPDVLLVPISALVRKDHKEVVEVQQKDGSTVDHPVEVGISDGTNDEVLSGLSEGDVVVLHRGPGDSRWSAGRGGFGRGR